MNEHKFAYWVELKTGYKRTQSIHEINVIDFEVIAPNRATADRMVKAMLSGNDNVVTYDGVCID